MSDNPKPANVSIAPWTFEEDPLDERLSELANVTIRDNRNLVVTNIFDIGPRARANAAFICEAVNYYVSQNPRVQIRRLRAERDSFRDLVKRLLAIAEPAVSELKEIDAAVLSVGGACVLPVAEKEAIIREARAALGMGLAPAASAAGKEGA